MKRMVLIFTGLTMLLSVAIATASTWNLVGTAGFTVETPSQLTDRKRPMLNSMLKDTVGNTWVSCSYEQDEVQAVAGQSPLYPHGSGVTVFKAGGGIVNVDVKALGYLGCITKMVQGGDGAIYVLSNYSNLEWTTYNQSSLVNPGYQDYILKLVLNPDNTVTVTNIYTPGPQGTTAIWTANGVVNKIGGMAVGGDGNIYWTQNGAMPTWKYRFFWRYDVVSHAVEEAPNRDGVTIAECGSETHRLLDLEYVGNDQFAIVGALSGNTWQCNPISWTVPEANKPENTSNPGWGRKWNTANAYDPLRKKLWLGGRSEIVTNEWTFNTGGATLPAQAPTPTVVDLGAGNSGINFISVNKRNNCITNNAATLSATQLTGAWRFRVDSYSTDANLCYQYNNSQNTTHKEIAAISLRIAGGRFKLLQWEQTGWPELVDLGPVVLGAWNELYIYHDSETKTCRVTWNPGGAGNTVVYNGTILTRTGSVLPSWILFASSFGVNDTVGSIGNRSATCTVTYDWVGQCIGEASTQAEVIGKHWLYVDGSKSPTGDPYFICSNIMTRFDGNPMNPAIFDGTGKLGGAANSYKVWHANTYDELNSAVPGKRNHGGYWITALAVNPDDGQAWMAYGADPTYEYEPVDVVRTVPVVFTGTKPMRGDEGVPEAGSQVVSLMFSGGSVYALTCSPVTGAYKLYSKTVTATGPTSVAGIKSKPLGTAFTTNTSKLVTLQGTGFFYIEDDDRASGIKVIPATGQPLGNVGQRAAISGFTDVVNGEAVVYANTVTLSSTADVVKPLISIVRDTGGAVSGIQPAVPAADSTAYETTNTTYASEVGKGLNTTGLLITVTGKLKWSLLNGFFEYIDDGSAFPILINTTSGTGGVADSMISVTGVSTVYWNTTTKVGFRTITPRGVGDITFPEN